MLEGYGLSESSPVASFNPRDRERKPGSIGMPIEGVEMKVVDDDGDDVSPGRGRRDRDPRPQRDEGLLANPEATAETMRDGWLHTGDMAKVDEDGYFFIVDRKKDLIIRGGYNVYPREVEEVLYEHPAVIARRRSSGSQDEQLGEEVGAAVALKDGASATADGAARVRQGAGGRLQVPASRLVRRRAPQGADRQDPQARDQAAGRRLSGVASVGPGAVTDQSPPGPAPSLATIAVQWGRIGLTGFGGPPTHIALLRRLVVDRRHWIDPREFEDAVGACNLLPGPASTQLASSAPGGSAVRSAR